MLKSILGSRDRRRDWGLPGRRRRRRRGDNLGGIVTGRPMPGRQIYGLPDMEKYPDYRSSEIIPGVPGPGYDREEFHRQVMEQMKLKKRGGPGIISERDMPWWEPVPPPAFGRGRVFHDVREAAPPPPRFPGEPFPVPGPEGVEGIAFPRPSPESVEKWKEEMEAWEEKYGPAPPGGYVATPAQSLHPIAPSTLPVDSGFMPPSEAMITGLYTGPWPVPPATHPPTAPPTQEQMLAGRIPYMGLPSEPVVRPTGPKRVPEGRDWGGYDPQRNGTDTPIREALAPQPLREFAEQVRDRPRPPIPDPIVSPGLKGTLQGILGEQVMTPERRQAIQVKMDTAFESAEKIADRHRR